MSVPEPWLLRRALPTVALVAASAMLAAEVVDAAAPAQAGPASDLPTGTDVQVIPAHEATSDTKADAARPTQLSDGEW